ncbi:hypothetical protein KCP76_22725 [Salmonella enterica subsp. enterica serovar Weltevreden]|nr:hypothetical protein KCP76_22725 [Salmonella enterica subsp. enterica serovar Weltevreden]
MRSPESNGIAESFVKTINGTTSARLNHQPAAVMNLAAFSHYNEHHPHSAPDIAHHGKYTTALVAIIREQKRSDI